MRSYPEERRECDAFVQVAINTMPLIVNATIEARHGDKPIPYRRERLDAAIELAEGLATELRKSRERLGWDRSDAA
jgi:hypothetical protein